MVNLNENGDKVATSDKCEEAKTKRNIVFILCLKLQSIASIQKAADKRKDYISEQIKNNTDFIKPGCTWHTSCMVSYINELNMFDAHQKWSVNLKTISNV